MTLTIKSGRQAGTLLATGRAAALQSNPALQGEVWREGVNVLVCTHSRVVPLVPLKEQRQEEG